MGIITIRIPHIPIRHRFMLVAFQIQNKRIKWCTCFYRRPGSVITGLINLQHLLHHLHRACRAFLGCSPSSSSRDPTNRVSDGADSALSAERFSLCITVVLTAAFRSRAHYSSSPLKILPPTPNLKAKIYGVKQGVYTRSRLIIHHR